MRSIAIVLTVCMVTLWGRTTIAQSTELRVAVAKAWELWTEREYDEAYAVLSAVEPTVSKTSPADSLERPYRSEEKNNNEFYLKDAALSRLSQAFLSKEKPDDAEKAAKDIANRPLRNDALLDVLNHRLHNLVAYSENFDQQLSKVEEIAALLTDRPRDDAYGRLALRYAYWGHLNSALECSKKIENATRRDDSLVSVVEVYKLIPPTKTPKNEEWLRAVVDGIQSPLKKARALQVLIQFYKRYPPLRGKTVIIDTEESKRKCLESLRELTALLSPLPDNEAKCEQLLLLYHFWHCDEARSYWDKDKRETEAAEVRKLYLECAANIKDDTKKFDAYAKLFYRRPEHGAPSLDVDLIEKMSPIAEGTTDLDTRIHRLTTVFAVAQSSTPTGSDERKRAFRDVFEAISVIDDGFRWPALMLPIIDVADKEEVALLLNEVTEVLLAHGSETVTANDRRLPMLKQVVVILAKNGDIDQMLTIAHSPRMPDDWKQTIYETAALELLRTSDDEKFHPVDFDKLFALIISPRKKVALLHRSEKHIPHRVSLLTTDWPVLIGNVVDISDQHERFHICLSLIEVIHRSKIDTDVRPLIDAMEQVTLTKEPQHPRIYQTTLEWSQRLAMWNQNKTVDWVQRQEAAIAQWKDPSDRFFFLMDMFEHAKKLPQDEAAKKERIDKLYTAAKNIPERNPAYRFLALRRTAERAAADKLPDDVRRIYDEALEFAKTMSETQDDDFINGHLDYFRCLVRDLKGQ